jgi:hypothetical protein
MPSTYTLNNGIELIGTGEQSGTWGDTTNTNLELLDTALDGQVTITATSAGSSSSPNDLPISDGSASNGRNRMVIITSATDLGADVYYQLTPNDAEKIIYVRNDLNAQDLILFQGTYSASNDYVVPNGKTAIIFFDGAGTGAVAANVFNNAHFDAMNVVGNVDVGGTLDVTGAVTLSDNLDVTGTLDVTDAVTLSDDLTVDTNSLFVDSTNNVVLAGSTSATNNVRLNQKLSTVSVGGNLYGGASHVSYSGTGVQPASTIDIQRSRGTTDGDYTKVESGDRLGIIIFRGADGSGFEDSAAISSYVDGATGDDDVPGRLVFETSSDGGVTLTERTRIASDGTLTHRYAAVFNEDGGNYDFRVEGDTQQYLIMADASSDRVGINQQTPYTQLQVNGDMRLGSSDVGSDDDAEYTISSGGQIVIHSNDSGADASYVALSLRSGKASSGNTDAIIDFYVNGEEKMRLNDSGYLGLGTNTPAQELHVFNDGTAGTSADNADIRVQGNNGSSGYMDVYHGPTQMGLYGASTSPFQIAWNSIGRLDMNGNETIFHDTGADYNFRIESTSYENMFFMDSGNDMIGIRTNSPDAALDVRGSLRYYNVRPGYSSTTGTGTSANWWKLGRASYLFGSRSLKITILGTSSYGAGGNIGGQTTILFRGNNASTTLDGTFWSETQGNSHVSSVAWKQTGTSDEFDIWVNWASTFAGVDIYVDTQATWEFGVLDTGSETTPSGATTISAQKHTFAGTVATISEYSSAVVVNEGGADVNFRVESDDYDHALYVDGGTNKVLIGTSDTTHTVDSYSLIVGVQGGTMKPHVLIDGTFTAQDIDTHGIINLSDENFGIGGGGFNTGSTADDLYLFAYEGAGRGIRFSTTLDGSTDRSESNSNWTTRGLIDANTGYWGIGNFAHSSPASRLLHVKGAIDDGAPLLYLQASSNTYSSSTFNWMGQMFDSSMPDTAGKRLALVIGQAASGGKSGYLAWGSGTDANDKSINLGIYNKDNIISANYNGFVSKQYQPFFYAKTNNSGDGQTANPYQFQNVVHNIGGMFVTSGTGAHERFVAPIDGVYAITVQPGYKQTGVDFSSRLRINGSEFTDLVRLISTVDPDSHSGTAVTVVIKLSEDDYVDAVPGFTPYHTNTSFNFFSAHLLS